MSDNVKLENVPLIQPLIALVPLIMLTTTARPSREMAAAARRSISRGALAGGFSKESLKGWASNFREQKQEASFVDLYSQKVSPQCASWLNTHSHPSTQLTKALFGSNRFVPERILLTPFSYHHRKLPTTLDDKIKIGQRFLLWTVVVDSPHEMILEWKVGSGKVGGYTMVAFDPSLRKVYQGNCLTFQPSSAGTRLHAWYAQFLLGGMIQHLEQEAIK